MAPPCEQWVQNTTPVNSQELTGRWQASFQEINVVQNSTQTEKPASSQLVIIPVTDLTAQRSADLWGRLRVHATCAPKTASWLSFLGISGTSRAMPKSHVQRPVVLWKTWTKVSSQYFVASLSHWDNHMPQEGGPLAKACTESGSQDSGCQRKVSGQASLRHRESSRQSASGPRP